MRWAAAALLLGGAAVAVIRRRWWVVTVVGTSMLPALQPGDVVLARRGDPRTVSVGDIVVLVPPTRGDDPPRPPRRDRALLVKRVVAGPGEPLPYGPPGVVPPGCVAVLGDNGGQDSRTFGPLPHDQVLGVVVRRLAAPSRAR